VWNPENNSARCLRALRDVSSTCFRMVARPL
jgi:hypothetical protein